MNGKRAVLFLNLGGPETQADVKSFLYRLFEDPEIIRLPFRPLRKLIAWLISTVREKKSQQMYAKIGGGSPIRRLTDQQAQATEAALIQKNKPALVRTAFSCSPPFIEDVVHALALQGVDRFLAFPLYPQYSLTTTKGALDRTHAAVKRFAPAAQLTEIFSWPIHPLFLRAHADMIRIQMRQFSKPSDENIHLLFSAHSIPEKLVTELGDPYQKQMNETVQAVIEMLEWRGGWSLGWQSKLGPQKWLGPSTADAVVDLGKRGVKQVLVVPIAFVTDHIETLYELDQELSETAKEAGIAEYRRTPGLNNHPVFIEALVDLTLQQKAFWIEPH